MIVPVPVVVVVVVVVVSVWEKTTGVTIAHAMPSNVLLSFIIGWLINSIRKFLTDIPGSFQTRAARIKSNPDCTIGASRKTHREWLANPASFVIPRDRDQFVRLVADALLAHTLSTAVARQVSITRRCRTLVAQHSVNQSRRGREGMILCLLRIKDVDHCPATRLQEVRN